MSSFARRIAKFSQARLALLASEQNARLEAMEAARREPIAIVGMGCRFPGGAASPEAFWNLLEGGVDAIGEIPPERWDVEGYFDPDPEVPGKMYCRHGGFLDEVDTFDPQFFNISPREAISLDPQHRLLLEVTWEALEHAGCDPTGLRNSRTGVFVGFGADDYAKLQVRHAAPESVSAYTGTGNAYCYGAGRLSFLLGLQGPSLPVDTACSSSLVVTHLACQSLRLRETNLAIAGGVHLMLSPVGSIFLSKAKALAPDGRCKTFDAAADGYSRGEGCGIVVLKRLSDALADGDTIQAVIRGSAVNHDGPSSGFTVPNGPAQQAVIRAALEAGGVDPKDLSYIEVHGTGTELGDPIEVRSLAAVLGRGAGRGEDRPLTIASVKTNIGHLEPAAGVAGMIKVALSLGRRKIPPHLHFQRVNPHIDLDSGPFVIPTEVMPWPSWEGPRLAGVSSFGLSGTNAHLILEEAPELPAPPPGEPERPLQVLTLSAKSEAALGELAERFGEHLDRHPEEPLADVCYTANTGRGRFSNRAAVVADNRAEVGEALRCLAAGREHGRVLRGRARSRSRPKVAFLYTGQGSQYPGMGRQLWETEPAFRRTLERCAEVLGPRLEMPLLEALYPSPGESSPLDETAFTQPALVALEMALTETFRAWGIEPAAVLGHSVGEISAAWAAGVFSFEDALSFAAERGRLMQGLPRNGAMAAVFAAEGRVTESLGELAELAGRVDVAAVNGPDSCVVSGEADAVEVLLDRLEEMGVKSRGLNVSHAFHSHLMEPVLEPLGELLAGVELKRPRLRLISNVSGEVAGDEVGEPDYWLQHARRAVRFEAGLRSAWDLGCRLFLELGPQPHLLAMGKRCLPEEAVWLPSLRPDRDWREMLASLATLFIQGVEVDWKGFDRDRPRRRRPLPTYPFQRQRYWVDLVAEKAARGAGGGGPLVIGEEAARRDAALGPILEALHRRGAEDGARAINRRATAPLVFFTSDRRAAFYLGSTGSTMVASVYLGPEEAFAAALDEILAYAGGEGIDLTVFAREHRLEVLQERGLTTTPIGVWQSLPDLAGFTLRGGAMKRLRSKVNSYTNCGDVAVEEYRPGEVAAVDREIVALIHDWVGRKGKRAPFVAMLAGEIANGTLDPAYRIFLTRHAGRLDSVILLTPIESKNGYLMDLEFYREGMPSGCLEYGITTILERLREEGSAYYSLGSTFGTQLGPYPGDDPEVRELLRTFYEQGVLNEDGNFIFKKKFHPETTRFFLCRRQGSGVESLPEVLRLLAEPAPPPTGGDAQEAADFPALDELRRGVEAGRVHPLAGRRLPLALAQAVFQSRLDLSWPRLAFLADHRIFGRAILPATAYLEAAVAAAAAVGPRPVELVGVALDQALALAPDGGAGATSLQIVLEPQEAGETAFRILSLGAGADSAAAVDWNLHASGRVRGTPAGGGSRLGGEGLDALRERCREEMAPGEYYERLREFGLEYGPAFQGLKEISWAYGEALGRIELPASLAASGDVFRLHPALLDACVQVHGAALLASRGGEGEGFTYLPVGIGRLRLSRPLSGQVWSYARIRPVEEELPETLIGDLAIFGQDGRPAVEIEGFEVRRTSAEVLRLLLEERRGDLLYEMRWQSVEEPRPAADATTSEAGFWLLLADSGGVAEELAAALEAGGDVCYRQRAAAEGGAESEASLDPCDRAALEAVLSQSHGESGLPCRGIVHLWGLDAAAAADLDLEALDTAQDLGCRALLNATQALAGTALPGNPQIWVVTRDTQPVRADDPQQGVASAPLWGLGRSIAQEHPELWGGLVDLPAAPAAAEGEWLARRLTEGLGEDHLALRGGALHVARLEPLRRLPASLPSSAAAEGTYLITGGLGGLGLALARHLVERGARHLALVGRSGKPGEETQAVLAELAEAGAEVRCFAADVSRFEDVERLFTEIGEALPPLVGVVHAAGVLSDGALLHQTWERFEEVMAPKVRGAWLLDRATAEMPLTDFVLFSSTAALFGAAGQANYAAANAFLDALAQARRAAGLAGLAVDWGPWGEVGMAARLGERAEAQRAAHGVGTLGTRQALALLDRLMASARSGAGPAQVGAIVVDWERLMSSAATALRKSSLFRELAAALTPADGGAFVETLREAAPGERVRVLEDHLAGRVAEVLRLEVSEVDREGSLTQMGFDSLMALELREKIEADLGVGVPVVNLIRGDNILELAAFLLDELGKKHPELASGAAEIQDPEKLLAQMDELSDEEVRSLLEDLLPQD